MPMLWPPLRPRLEVDRGCDPPDLWDSRDFLESFERCEFRDEDLAPGAASLFEDFPLPLAFSNVFSMFCFCFALSLGCV